MTYGALAAVALVLGVGALLVRALLARDNYAAKRLVRDGTAYVGQVTGSRRRGSRTRVFVTWHNARWECGGTFDVDDLRFSPPDQVTVLARGAGRIVAADFGPQSFCLGIRTR